jgi:hypothetical protein
VGPTEFNLEKLELLPQLNLANQDLRTMLTQSTQPCHHCHEFHLLLLACTRKLGGHLPFVFEKVSSNPGQSTAAVSLIFIFETDSSIPVKVVSAAAAVGGHMTNVGMERQIHTHAHREKALTLSKSRSVEYVTRTWLFFIAALV